MTLTQEWIRAGGLHDIPAAARAWACRFILQDLRRRYPMTALEHVSQSLADAESRRYELDPV